MAVNQTVESPNFDKIASEAGQVTSDAINLLWLAINDSRATERRNARLNQERVYPKVLVMVPTATVTDLDLQGASVLSFTGTTAVNVTGFIAPETNQTRIVFCQVSGSATITFQNAVTSQTANQLVLSTGADTARATNTGIVFAYLASKWREVART